MYVLMLVTEALRVANKYSPGAIYTWRIVTPDGAPVVASNDMSVTPECSINQLDDIDTLCVIAGYDPQQAYSKRLFQRLNQLNNKQLRIGCIDSGAFLLAKAGLLDDMRITLHWQALSVFVEVFPALTISDELFTLSGRHFTCAGGVATLDLMLTLIANDIDDELALKVAQDFIHDYLRLASADQRIALDHRWLRFNPRLAQVIEIMEQNLESPLAAGDLVEQSGITRRQMERMFKRDLGQTTMRYYLQLRLNRAREMVLYSELGIREVSMACGFNSLASFSRAYRREFGNSAREQRAHGCLVKVPETGTNLKNDANSRSV